MKVLMLAEARNPHTIKWARGLAERGFSVLIFTLFEYDLNTYIKFDNVEVVTASLNSSLYNTKEGSFSKIKFLSALPKLKKNISGFQPDILHAHYVSSYGILGALSRFHPFVISVWGNDIYEVPRKSVIHEKLIKFALTKADMVLSTSKVMAKETSKYTNKKIEVTPFGIDLKKFKTAPRPESDINIVIGTIKSLEDKYGIEYLIKAFKIVKDKHPKMPLKLLIVGGGSKENQLKELAHSLNIQDDTTFTGKINYDDVIEYHNKLSISVFPSILDGESFGVSVIESSACEVPVIVSDVGGLPEVVNDGITGIVVEPKNEKAIAKAIEKLISDEQLRHKMGKCGRERVQELYNFEDNLNKMISLYKIIENSKSTF